MLVGCAGNVERVRAARGGGEGEEEEEDGAGC